ncbi:hypothetical protein [Streptosporangium vulgare]|uniref:hypothetical protein n=1 Tax=Streptosporangium vulgare TaxID=46190 RepID=UPI003CD0B98B
MAEEGVLDDDRPVILGDDPGADAIPAADTVLTDTMRRRELVVSDLRRPYGETMTPDEPYEGRGPAYDLTDPAWADPKTVAVFTGIKGVTASSSQSRLGVTPGTRDGGQQPYAAVDFDLRTGWRSTGWKPPTEQWLEVRFTEPISVPSMQAVFERSENAVTVSEVMVETDTGRVRTRLGLTSLWEKLNVPQGRTSRLRIRVTGVLRDPNPRVGITELSIPGVRPGRTLVVPAEGPASSAGTSEPGRTVVTSRTDTAPRLHARLLRLDLLGQAALRGRGRIRLRQVGPRRHRKAGAGGQGRAHRPAGGGGPAHAHRELPARHRLLHRGRHPGHRRLRGLRRRPQDHLVRRGQGPGALALRRTGQEGDPVRGCASTSPTPGWAPRRSGSPSRPTAASGTPGPRRTGGSASRR